MKLRNIYFAIVIMITGLAAVALFLYIAAMPAHATFAAPHKDMIAGLSSRLILTSPPYRQLIYKARNISLIAPLFAQDYCGTPPCDQTEPKPIVDSFGRGQYCYNPPPTEMPQCPMYACEWTGRTGKRCEGPRFFTCTLPGITIENCRQDETKNCR